MAKWLTMTAIISVPLVVFSLVAIEFVLHQISKEERSRLPSKAWWICLLLIFVLLTIAIYSPTMQIITGLQG